jgi:hypothetical protein
VTSQPNQEVLMTTTFMRDRYIDPDICQDGETTRRPLVMMDGQPGYARPSDDQVAARRSSRQEMIRASQDAWRSADARKKPPPDDPDPDEDDDDDDDDVDNPRDARACARRSYDAMCSRLRDAWRSPPSRDAAEPDMGTPPLLRRPLPHDDPAAAMRGHLSAGPGPAFGEPDAQRRRDAAYESYTSTLSNAWRNPPHALAAPPAILGAGPAHKVVEPGRTDPGAASRIERVRERTHGGR